MPGHHARALCEPLPAPARPATRPPHDRQQRQSQLQRHGAPKVLQEPLWPPSESRGLHTHSLNLKVGQCPLGWGDSAQAVLQPLQRELPRRRGSLPLT